MAVSQSIFFSNALPDSHAHRLPSDKNDLSSQEKMKMISQSWKWPVLFWEIIAAKIISMLLIWTCMDCIHMSEGCHLAISMTLARLTCILGTMWVGHDQQCIVPEGQGRTACLSVWEPSPAIMEASFQSNETLECILWWLYPYSHKMTSLTHRMKGYISGHSPPFRSLPPTVFNIPVAMGYNKNNPRASNLPAEEEKLSFPNCC